MLGNSYVNWTAISISCVFRDIVLTAILLLLCISTVCNILIKTYIDILLNDYHAMFDIIIFSEFLRTGRPAYPGSWVDQVSWIPGMLDSSFFSE